MANPLIELQKIGQSIWLDYLRRGLIESGELKRMVDEDGLSGVTTNPTIFEKALSESSDYNSAIHHITQQDPHIEGAEVLEALIIEDIKNACDIFLPIYQKTGGRDGFVSMEVSPHLAYDTDGTIKEARRLWDKVDRPNLMIKVPATKEGIPAIEELIANGVNVNITLIFSLSHYEAVAQAYIRGLRRASRPEAVSSVASFFVSRVDRKVDHILDAIDSEEAMALRGKAAIANAKMAYKRFKEIFYGEAFQTLREKGWRIQRPLWASTSTKDPRYSDVLYVENLIGSDTVNTIPPSTYEAFKDHGKVRPTLEEGIKEAEDIIERIGALGIDLEAISDELQKEGVASFARSFDSLVESINKKVESLRRVKAVPKRYEAFLALDLGPYKERIEERLSLWERDRFASRLWRKDPTIWFKEPTPEITNRLGWLDLPERMLEEADRILDFAEEVKREGIKDVVLLGMGGSSLAPRVFMETFGNASGFPGLTVLDTTHPKTIKDVTSRLSLEETLFIVSSKSGTTVETLSLFKYLWHRCEGLKEKGRHFVTITDPGTPLERLGRERGFRAVFTTPPDVGGRYAALSTFGLLPAALIGVDIHRLLDEALTLRECCVSCVPYEKNPCLLLGAAVGELALAGRDKLTFFSSPSIKAFPLWLEQLIAESTGKDGKGIIPVVDEPPGSRDCYGEDRCFVHIHLNGEDTLQEIDLPALKIRLKDPMEMGREILLWEVAVASAGSILSIHPFNQPDVELAKELARKALGGSKKEGIGLSLGDSKKALSDLLSTVATGDYIGLQAYLPEEKETHTLLQEIRIHLRDRFKVATTLGYGPRFLHSTGQLHKGGPNTGVFIQLVDDPEEVLSIPEEKHTFNQLIRAQAWGDYKALKERGRRVLSIDVKDQEGLRDLLEMVRSI